MLVVNDLKINLSRYPERFSDDEFYEFCQLNSDLRIERDAERNIFITAPTGGGSGRREFKLMGELYLYLLKHPGEGFSSSTGFQLPNGAIRSPDACWVSPERWAEVAENDKELFIPVVPNFVVEVRSRTDSLAQLTAKMAEWIEQGVELAWLLDIQNERSYIYRNDGSVDVLNGFDRTLGGESILPGFSFDAGLLKD